MLPCRVVPVSFLFVLRDGVFWEWVLRARRWKMGRVAVRCGALRCVAVRCGSLRCGAVRCGKQIIRVFLLEHKLAAAAAPTHRDGPHAADLCRGSGT